MDNPDKITYFGEADFRSKKTRFGIKAKDRTRHIYIIGKTGVGKSTLLENMAVQDIQGGEGIAFIDPHGETAEKLLDYVPEHRIQDVIYFAPFDIDYPVSFNVMEDVGADKRHLVASGLMTTFKKIWADQWSARMEYILNNIILALLEYPNSTILGVNRMLADKDYRNTVVANVTDPGVKAFWIDEFAKYGERYMQEAGAAIQNKIGQFTANPLIRNIVGQPKSTFNFRDAMDDRKIVLINLSKGRMGDQNAALLGGMIISKIYVSAMSRADITDESVKKKLPTFYFYVDEFQNFANDSFANILSEARKYKLALTVANQFVAQMEESVRDAVFGNVGSTISFRVGPLDGPLLEQVFSPVFTEDDLKNLGFAQIYLSLCVDGIGSKPFSANTLGPIQPGPVSFKEQVIEFSRRVNARPRASVEEEIQRWHNQVFAQPKAPREDRQTGEKEFPPKRKNDYSKPEGERSHKPFVKVYDNTQSREDRGEKRPYVPKENGSRPEIQVPQPSLRSLLDKLEIPVETAKKVETPVPEEEVKPKPEPVQEVKQAVVSESPKPVKPLPFKNSLRKAPDAPNETPARDALRSLLSSIGTNTEEKPKEVPVQAPPEVKKEDPTPVKKENDSLYVPRTPKEVPETVLRNILEDK